ncbi:MAG: hypothetical protein KF718_12545 [Polyangiaceae bacterium]|nr:hypothetical protein [Polyangiaceae bacterium]
MAFRAAESALQEPNDCGGFASASMRDPQLAYLQCATHTLRLAAASDSARAPVLAMEKER